MHRNMGTVYGTTVYYSVTFYGTKENINVVCDYTNNPPSALADNSLYIDIWLPEPATAEFETFDFEKLISDCLQTELLQPMDEVLYEKVKIRLEEALIAHAIVSSSL